MLLFRFHIPHDQPITVNPLPWLAVLAWRAIDTGVAGAQAVRRVIAAHTGRDPPPLPLAPRAAAHGRLELARGAALLDALPVLAPGGGIPAAVPGPMEAYGQW